MRIGIVGSEQKKFTIGTEEKAREMIRILLRPLSFPGDLVVSGGCHLGGVDIFAIDEANKMKLRTREYLPPTRNWEGYKFRNMLIAENSDVVYCITVKTLPLGYVKRGFESYCYHCKTNEHIKSGGCWTVKQARLLGKLGYILVVNEDAELE